MEESKLTEIFKTEYSKLIAVLCQFYGVKEIQIAEDIVSETFLTAMKTWAHNGVPDQPGAWLRKVAKNKLLDQYKRNKIYENNILPNLPNEKAHDHWKEISENIIEDSQLKMIFVVCSPKVNDKAKICLALRILCGFNINEIAKAILSNTETVNKILYRAKKKIKEEGSLQLNLTKEDYEDRVESVLRIIYLLFNEGYYSSLNEQNLQVEICWEAMRLAIQLSQKGFKQQSSIDALISLMCFHASRFDARNAGDSNDLTFYQQDKSMWDKALIAKGVKYLNQASTGQIVTKYHLEASIAYWHTTDHPDKWENILQLYNRLLTIEYSSTIAMNRTYAFAKANSVNQAIEQASKLELKTNNLYYCLMAELYKMKGDKENEVIFLRKALGLSKKKQEINLIKSKLEQASQ
ncbi:MAG: sigma-70 family RNA polymerase sigma factor [Flavobacteriales bacterium]|nr:sigma-70 family RNA polymerase sigma factor [Flavobacteriales bacterium]